MEYTSVRDSFVVSVNGSLMGSEAMIGIVRGLVWRLIKGGSIRGYTPHDAVVRFLAEDPDGHATSVVGDILAIRSEVDRISFGLAVLTYIRANCSGTVRGSTRMSDGSRRPHKFRTLEDAEDHATMIESGWRSVFDRVETAEQIEKIRQTLTERESRLLEAIIVGKDRGHDSETICRNAGFKNRMTMHRNLLKIREKIAAA